MTAGQNLAQRHAEGGLQTARHRCIDPDPNHRSAVPQSGHHRFLCGGTFSSDIHGDVRDRLKFADVLRLFQKYLALIEKEQVPESGVRCRRGILRLSDHHKIRLSGIRILQQSFRFRIQADLAGKSRLLTQIFHKTPRIGDVTVTYRDQCVFFQSLSVHRLSLSFFQAIPEHSCAQASSTGYS